MARARNIKPGFFTNGDLADNTPLARLLFIGLWTICDRDGRLRDKPRDIKARCLPFDDCDCDALLAELDKTGFIRRYTVKGESCIWVPNFTRHQHVHPSEAASELPAYEAAENSDEKIKPDLTGQKRPLIESPILNTDNPLTPKGGSESSSLFDGFWKLYPHKVSKPHALKAWKAKGCDGKVDAVMDGLRRWLESADWKQRPQDKLPYPATWLNGERWNDKPAATTPPAQDCWAPGYNPLGGFGHDVQ